MSETVPEIVAVSCARIATTFSKTIKVPRINLGRRAPADLIRWVMFRHPFASSWFERRNRFNGVSSRNPLGGN